MSRALGSLAIAVTALAPLALCFEPFARYPQNRPAAWLGVLAVIPLALVALKHRRVWVPLVALAHGLWLVGAYLSFSTVGEIWCASQLILCGGSALSCAALALLLGSKTPMTFPTRYGLGLLLGLGATFAVLSASRGLWDGATWAVVHHEADGLVRHVRSTGDASGYDADVGWAFAALTHRTTDCDDGSTGYYVAYSIATSGTHHSFNTCPDRGAWFYYPD